MTLTFHFRPISVWLFLAVPSLLVLGFVLMGVTGRLGWELASLLPLNVCFMLACLAFVLAVGSML